MMTVYFADGTIYEPTIQQAEDATNHGETVSPVVLAQCISDMYMCGKISAPAAVYLEACKILG